MNKKIWFFYIVLTVPIYCFSQEREISILFFNSEQQNFYKIYFTEKRIAFIEENRYLNILYNINLLKFILQTEALRIDVIRDNIENALTTRTIEGGAFQRKFIKLSSENEITVENDIKEGRIVYDPLHPDRLLEGKMKDYVIYPNVDLNYEYKDLFDSILLYNGIVEYFQRNNIDIIVDKLPILSFIELNHQRKIERIIELFLRLKTEELLNK
jgi:flagellar basal-body rod protein FlgC